MQTPPFIPPPPGPVAGHVEWCWDGHRWVPVPPSRPHDHAGTLWVLMFSAVTAGVVLAFYIAERLLAWQLTGR